MRRDTVLELCVETGSVVAFGAFQFPKSARKYRERVSRGTEFLHMEYVRQQREFTYRREMIKIARKNAAANERQPLDLLAVKWIFVVFFVSQLLPILSLLFEIALHNWRLALGLICRATLSFA